MNPIQKSKQLGVLLGALVFATAFTAQAASDKSFVKDAAKGNQFEIQAGQLAEKQGQSEMVKQLGQQISADHMQANQQLQSVAQKDNLQMPTEPANERELKDLSKKQGAEFDNKYVELMVKDHQKDIKKYEKQAKDTKDPAVKQYAEQNIAILQKHLQMSQQTQAALKQGSSMGAGSNGGSSKSQ